MVDYLSSDLLVQAILNINYPSPCNRVNACYKHSPNQDERMPKILSRFVCTLEAGHASSYHVAHGTGIKDTSMRYILCIWDDNNESE